jgi:hypothetical protein
MTGSRGLLVGLIDRKLNKITTKQLSLKHMYVIDAIVFDTKKIMAIVAGEVNTKLSLKFYHVPLGTDEEKHL